MIKSVLFVCTGNTCRSFMAEQLLRHHAKNHKLYLEVASAGLAAFTGDAATDHALEVLVELGIDGMEHRARRIQPRLLDEFDLILPMTSSHKEQLLTIAPELAGKIFLLKEFAESVDPGQELSDPIEKSYEISDPFGKSLEVYRQAREEIDQAVQGIINYVLRGGATYIRKRGDDDLSTVHVVSHPLVQHKLTMIRDEETGPKDFRDLVEEVSVLMAYEVTRDMPLEDVEVDTPMGKMTGRAIAGRQVGVVPILRAGLGMVNGVLRLIPTAKVGHIGLYRDPETLLPVEYYCKLPVDVEERQIIVLDPMLATGGSAAAAITFLKQRGVSSIKLMCLLAAPEGIELMQREHPDVDVFTAAIDERLNSHGYIIPGLGDAGDRLFGTK